MYSAAALLILVDVAIYYPFLKVYDEQILEEERSGKANDELKEKVAANFNTAKADAILEKAGVEAAQNTITEETNVLVLCAGGGTSGLLANALNKEFKDPYVGNWRKDERNKENRIQYKRCTKQDWFIYTKESWNY